MQVSYVLQQIIPWLFICAVLDPDPVQSLKVVVNEDIPSMTLSWMRPGNVQVVEELTEHRIRFKPFGDEEYVEKTVSGSTSSLVLTRESGLVPLINYHFQVCAQSGYCKGEWKELTSFFGKHCVNSIARSRKSFLFIAVGYISNSISTYVVCIFLLKVIDFHITCSSSSWSGQRLVCNY